MRWALSAAAVARLREPGRYAVGDGAYLQISQWGTKAWVLRYVLDGKSHYMGLGSCALVTLAEARSKARDGRRLLLDGVDPIAARRTARHKNLLNSSKLKTFKECAEAYIAAHEKSWRNRKSHTQWVSSLEQYVYPKIGQLSVADIDDGLVLEILEPIWTRIPETAGRVRGRVENILAWARVRKLREGDNPARWRGHLDHVLPALSKLRRVKHHAALPYGEVGAFMADLRNRTGISPRALEFTILTATRKDEARGARWSEIKDGVWTIPPERMKGEREHRIPLSKRALELLASLPREGDFIFTGTGADRPLGVNALNQVLARMRRTDLTVHGFRSTFRDWAAETTGYPNHVVEMALAHSIGDAVEAAYRRGDLFEKRRRLMEDWGNYCQRGKVKGDVVPLREAKR
jgi:integrase